MTSEPFAKAATILIADDRANSRELIRAVLENEGYSIEEADDGVDALRRARELKPDLIVLDIQMPGLDGLAVIGELRNDENFALTPVMALTANAMPEDRQRALDAGFDSYISKPVPLPVLRSEVSRLLHESRPDGSARSRRTAHTPGMVE